MQLSWLLSQLSFTVLLSLQTTRTAAQELPNPLFQRNQFNTTQGSFRQNVCALHEAYARGDVPLADALQGLELRPILGETQFFRLDPETGGLNEDYPGLMVVVLDEVARRAKFTWRDTYAAVDDVPIEGKTYTELLQWTTENYDVAVSYWLVSVERNSLGIGFPQGWYDGSIMLVTRRTEDSNSKFEAFLWLRPFTDSVWLLILVSIVVSGLVYWLLELIDHKSDRGQLHASPMENIFLSAVTFTGHFEFQPRTTASRLFTISLTFWALMTAAAYTANLASFLVVENTPAVQINSIEDAVRLRAPICILESSQTDTAVTKAFPSAKLIRKRYEEDVLLGVRNGECLVAATTLSSWVYYEGQSRVNGECELEWVGRIFRNVPAGFATRSDAGELCTSLIRDVMNLHLLEMTQDGFLEEAWSEYLERVSDTQCSADDMDDADATGGQQQLDLDSMLGVFVFHFGLSSVAIVLALVGVNFSKYQKRNAKKKKQKNRTTCQSTSAEVPEQRPDTDSEHVSDSSLDDFSDTTDLQMRSLRAEIRRLNGHQIHVMSELANQVAKVTAMLEDSREKRPIGATNSLMVGDLDR